MTDIETKMGTCSVDLATKTIRFEGCENPNARRAAIRARIELVKEMMARPKGFTNRERRSMKRELDFLSWALYPFDPVHRRIERLPIFNRQGKFNLHGKKGFAIHLRKSGIGWARDQWFDAEWEKHFGHVL